jgi:hypothetical protein
MNSWKEPKTILRYKKRSRDEVENWRPISITNCMDRIFTCLMARALQDVNSRTRVFSESQKCFIHKTNGCSKHGIMLNQLLDNAHRNKEDLAVTVVDFTNVFGSVLQKLIMSAMRQRNFLVWAQRIFCRSRRWCDISDSMEARSETRLSTESTALQFVSGTAATSGDEKMRKV